MKYFAVFLIISLKPRQYLEIDLAIYKNGLSAKLLKGPLVHILFENILGFKRADLLVHNLKHYIELKSLCAFDESFELVYINGLGMLSDLLS